VHAFDPVNLGGVTAIGYRVSSGGNGGTIEVRVDSPTGPLVQSAPVPSTGGWDDYVEPAPSPITDPGGTHRLYFVFRGGRGALLDLDTITFRGPGTVKAVDVPAEALTGQQGVAVHDRETARGGKWVGEIHDGDWVSYAAVDLSQTAGLGYRVSSAGVGGTIEARADSPTGPLVHEPVAVPVTGSWDLYLDLAPSKVGLTGVHDPYLVFKGAVGHPLFDVDTVRHLRYQPLGPACRPVDVPVGQPAVRDAVLKPPGQWNTYEVVVSGQRIRVFLNGALVNDFTGTDPARDLTRGHIGLQNHGDGDDVWFRDIRVKELSR